MNYKNHRCLLINDMQVDFCPGGSLAISEADKIIPVINRYTDLFDKHSLPVFATRDWHPENSNHFNTWPKHCIQNTRGAGFHPELILPASAIILSKGVDPNKHGYSAFEATDPDGHILEYYLKKLGIKSVFIAGVATDFCVKTSVVDGIAKGYNFFVLTDAVKAVNKQPEDEKKALAQMRAKGARFFKYDDVAGLFNNS